MPNHVAHKFCVSGEGAETYKMEMRMRTPSESKTGGPMDFDIWCPSKKPWDYGDAVSTHGTKWNAYSQTDWYYDGWYGWCIDFKTAWSTPEPVWQKIAEENPPGVRIDVYYVDESLDSNLGHVIIENGKISWDELSDASVDKKIELLTVTHPGIEWMKHPTEDYIIEAEYLDEYLEDGE